jgi:hypothetical protein
MNQTPIWKCHNLPDGRIHIVNKIAFMSYVKTFKDKTYQLIVRKMRKPRSLDQNSYYWGVVLSLICEHTGYEPEELHEALKRKFLIKRTDKGLEFVESTTNLTTTGMMEYIDKVIKFAATELDVVIPDSDGVITE